MKINPFKLERYFALYEFNTPNLLCCSDCEPLTKKEVLDLADNDTLKMWKNLTLGYTESSGNPILREEVSKLYKSAVKDDVLIVVPEEGIFIIMNSILNKGDHIITTFPGYQSLYEIASLLGCQISRWVPRDKKRWIFDINDFKSMLNKKTKLIIINFPHNPTGALIKKDELKEIISIAKQKKIFVFSDEMYRLLEYKKSHRLGSLTNLYENGVSLFGMSKTFALAGLRIGWLVTKNKKLMKKFIEFKDYTTICNSAPSEILSIIALRAKEKILDRNLKIIKKNLSLIKNFFNVYSNIFKFNKPEAGPIAFPELTTGENINRFCLNLNKEKGVLLLPSGVYDYHRNNFRIGFARKNVPHALEKFEEFLKEKYDF